MIETKTIIINKLFNRNVMSTVIYTRNQWFHLRLTQLGQQSVNTCKCWDWEWNKKQNYKGFEIHTVGTIEKTGAEENKRKIHIQHVYGEQPAQ